MTDIQTIFRRRIRFEDTDAYDEDMEVVMKNMLEVGFSKDWIEYVIDIVGPDLEAAVNYSIEALNMSDDIELSNEYLANPKNFYNYQLSQPDNSKEIVEFSSNEILVENNPRYQRFLRQTTEDEGGSEATFYRMQGNLVEQKSLESNKDAESFTENGNQMIDGILSIVIPESETFPIRSILKATRRSALENSSSDNHTNPIEARDITLCEENVYNLSCGSADNTIELDQSANSVRSTGSVEISPEESNRNDLMGLYESQDRSQNPSQSRQILRRNLVAFEISEEFRDANARTGLRAQLFFRGKVFLKQPKLDGLISRSTKSPQGTRPIVLDIGVFETHRAASMACRAVAPPLWSGIYKLYSFPNTILIFFSCELI